MNLPRVLVVDDQFGRFIDARRDLCALLGLRDITGDDSSPENPHGAVAEAVFCPAQRIRDGVISNDVEIALAAIREGWPFRDGSHWALLLLDLRFVSGVMDKEGVGHEQPGDDEFGLEILRAVKARISELPIVVLSSRERARVIEDCRQLGAADFIQRHPEEIGTGYRELLEAKIREYGLLEDDRNAIVGRSIALLRVLAAARRAATGSGNVLILGDSGVGKELLARYIHDHSPHRSGPYKVFHAFGSAETLQEDLLFGHVRGAFTDARQDRPGLFEQADGGTLFIDEVGDIPESLQNKLLRPIETRCVTRQGAETEKVVSIQLVLATNKALDESVQRGRFKFDLLNRIRTYTITLPPLRERREDIPLLVERLLEHLCRENGARWPRSIQPDAMEKLVEHDWREGNIRELRNVLERVVKDNKDAEIVVAGDLRFEGQPRVSLDTVAPVDDVAAEDLRGGWLAGMREITPESDYAALHGSWATLRREVALLFGRYLASAIEATRRRRANGPVEGEINLAGAVSCLVGRQVPTVQAADFLKRLLQFDDDANKRLFAEYPVLREVLEQALRSRPKSQRKPRTRGGGPS